MLKAQLKGMLEDLSRPAARRFALLVQCLIVFSLITFSIETLPNLSADQQRWLDIIETVIVATFTVEYIARIWVADVKRQFIFSFYGLVDAIAILPFYLALGFDLRSVRILRLLRLFRILKLVRYNRAVLRLFSAFKETREELLVFGFVALLVIYLAAVGIYYCEYEAQPEVFSSVFHSLWWAVVTLTAVGYGDAYPITLGGRLFTFGVLIVGLGIVAVPTALIAAAMADDKQEK